MVGAHHEEHILACPLDLAEGGDERRAVAVTDVVLVTSGDVGAVGLRDQGHLGRIDVSAMGAFGESEAKHASFLEQLGGAVLGLLVVPHPDRPQAEDGDLPRVPVAEPVEAEHLVVFGQSPHVPSSVLPSIHGGSQQRGKRPMLANEAQIVLVPGHRLIVGLDLVEPLVLEERDGLLDDLLRKRVGVFVLMLLGMEQKHSHLAAG